MTEIRKYRDGDENGIFKLWKEIFGDLREKNDIFDINYEWWKWRVLESPNGFPEIYIGEDQGKIIAHHMAERFTIDSKEGEKTIYQGLLSMADEKYRGLTLLKVVNKCAKETKDSGSMAYGFPNKASEYLFEKFGWMRLGEVPILGRPLYQVFNIYDFKKNNNEYNIERVDKFDEEINIFTKRIKEMFRYSMKRDNKILNWKYSRNPQKNYEKIILRKKGEIKGYAVYRNGKFNNIKTGIILDIFSEDDSGFNTILSEIIEYFKREKMKFISCYMINNSFYYKILKRRGFFKIPKLLLPKRNSIVILNASEYVLNVNNWYISYGDWDCV